MYRCPLCNRNTSTAQDEICSKCQDVLKKLPELTPAKDTPDER